MPREGSEGKMRDDLNNSDYDHGIPPDSFLGRMLRF